MTCTEITKLGGERGDGKEEGDWGWGESGRGEGPGVGVGGKESSKQRTEVCLLWPKLVSVPSLWLQNNSGGSLSGVPTDYTWDPQATCLGGTSPLR